MSNSKSSKNKSPPNEELSTDSEVTWTDFDQLHNNDHHSESSDTSSKSSKKRDSSDSPPKESKKDMASPRRSPAKEKPLSVADPVQDIPTKKCRSCQETYPLHKNWFSKAGLTNKGGQRYLSDCRVCVVKAQNETRLKEGQPERPLPVLGEPRKTVTLNVPEPVPKKQLPASNSNPWSKPKPVPQPSASSDQPQSVPEPTPDMILNPKPESIPDSKPAAKVEVDKDGRTTVTLKKEAEPKPETKIIAPKPPKGTMENIFPDENVKYIEPPDPDDEIDYEFLRSELYKLEVVYHPTAKMMNITPQTISDAGPDEILMMHDRLNAVSRLGSTANLLYHGLLGVAGILEQTMISSEKVTNQIDAHGYKNALRDDENTLALVRELALEYEEEFAEFVGVEYRLGFHSLTTLLETSYKNKNPDKLKDGQNGKTPTRSSSSSR